MAGTQFRLTYRLTREDIAAYVALKRELPTGQKILFFILLLLTGGITAYVFDALGFEDSLWTTLAVAVVVPTVAWAIGWLTMRGLRALRVQRAPLQPNDTVLSADAGGVTVETAGLAVQHKWSAIGQVLATRGHVYLMYAPTRAIIVPARAFASADAMARFAAFADAASSEASGA